MIHLDTHVVAWLYAGCTDRFPVAARSRIDQEDLYVSPMVVLELEYLFETGRVAERARVVVDDLAQRIGLRTSPLPFERVVREALAQSWTRDPFDRLVVGQALAEGAPLLTKDRTIHANCAAAEWD